MFYLDLQDLFSKLSKISNDRWQIKCMFDNWSWSPVYTTEEVCQIIDKVFSEYKQNPSKDANWILDTINIVSKHAIIENNDFSSLSKDDIIEAIVSLSKSYDEISFIRRYEPGRFLIESENLYGEADENGLDYFNSFESLCVDKSKRFFLVY